MEFSFQRFRYLLKARNLEFFRDKGALAWSLIFPLLIVFAFSYVFNMDDHGVGNIGYLGTPPETIERSFFKWLPYEQKSEAIAKLRHHKLDLVVDFRSEPTNYWLSQSSMKSRLAETLLLGQKNATNQNNFVRTSIETKEIKYVEWLIPGLVAMNVMWMALWGVGWVIVRHRKLGILKRLKASPLTAFEYLLVQMVSRLFILIPTGVFIFLGAYLIHPFEIVGSIPQLVIVYTLGCLSLSSMGLIVAARMESDELASGLLNLISFPMMFFSEIWFSLEGSGEWAKLIAKCLPLYHMADGMRKIMNEGYSITQLTTSIGLLLSITILCTLVGSLTFKWTRNT